MPITIRKYVDVTSAVGGASLVRARDLIGRIISPASVLNPGEVLEFTDLNDVSTVFAPNTPEYQYASLYFGFVSKLATGARRLSFARWIQTAVAPKLVGAGGKTGATALASIKACTSVTLRVTAPDKTFVDVVITGLSLDGADYATVATQLQTAIRAAPGAAGVPQLTTALVTYTASPGRFVLQGSVTNSSTIEAIATGDAADLGPVIGWTVASGAVAAPGGGVQTPLEAVIASNDVSDNYGSFGFIDSSAAGDISPNITQDDVIEIATWNHAQNVKYIYCVPTTIGDAPSLFNAIGGLSGAAISVTDGTWAQFCPMEVFAATDYTRANASQNYMYIQFAGRTPTVRDTITSDSMDAVRANYIGETMTAGQRISFYQRGVMTGTNTAPLDMNVYANEVWLKDGIVSSSLNAFLGLPRIPANDVGRGMILANLQETIARALTNGTISTGRLLTQIQKQQVTLLTNDPLAWQQVQDIGYWINVNILPYQTADGRTEYKATYLLVYAKDDQVRKVEGSNVLI